MEYVKIVYNITPKRANFFDMSYLHPNIVIAEPCAIGFLRQFVCRSTCSNSNFLAGINVSKKHLRWEIRYHDKISIPQNWIVFLS